MNVRQPESQNALNSTRSQGKPTCLQGLKPGKLSYCLSIILTEPNSCGRTVKGCSHKTNYSLP